MKSTLEISKERWAVDEPQPGWIYVVDSNGARICTIAEGVVAEVRDRGNACRIAAMPKLLEALEGIMPVFWNDSMKVLREVYKDQIEFAEVAIAGAKGDERE